MTVPRVWRDPVEEHVKTKAVATCEQCPVRRTKFRAPMNGNPTFCPDCGYALRYERLTKSQIDATSKVGSEATGVEWSH